jgi:hypothetical protein
VDNAEIVASIAAGELDGLAAALEKYADPLFGHCQLIAPACATQAVHDAFIVAWEQLGGLGDPDRLYPWLQAVAERECGRQMLIAGPAAATGTPQAGALPPELPGQVCSACADNTPGGRAYRVGVAYQAGPFGHDGFPKVTARTAKWPRRISWPARVAAAVTVIALVAVTIAVILPAGSSRHNRASAAPPGTRPRAGSAVPGASPPTMPAQRISSSAGPQPSNLPAPSTAQAVVPGAPQPWSLPAPAAAPSTAQAVVPGAPQPWSLPAPSAAPSTAQAVVPVASPSAGSDGDGDGS